MKARTYTPIQDLQFSLHGQNLSVFITTRYLLQYVTWQWLRNEPNT